MTDFGELAAATTTGVGRRTRAAAAVALTSAATMHDHQDARPAVGQPSATQRACPDATTPDRTRPQYQRHGPTWTHRGRFRGRSPGPATATARRRSGSAGRTGRPRALPAGPCRGRAGSRRASPAAGSWRTAARGRIGGRCHPPRPFQAIAEHLLDPVAREVRADASPTAIEMIAGSCGRSVGSVDALAQGEEDLLLAPGPGEVVVAGALARAGVGEGGLAVEVVDAGRQVEADRWPSVQPP